MLMIMKWTSGTFSFFSTFERIAKKILLAQIKANYSSGDDISSDEETQEDESESDGDQEVKQGKKDKATDENGKSSLWASSCASFKKHKCVSFFEFGLSEVN